MRRVNLVLCLMVLAFQLVKAQDGNLQVINISADTSMNLVEVSLEDSVLVDSLSFNEASAYLTVPAGNGQTLTFTSIKYPTQKIELTALDIANGEFYQSILNGIVDPTSYAPNPESIALDINASWNVVDTSNVASNQLRVNFFHGVSDAVELDIADFILEYIVDNMSYNEYSSNSTDVTKEERKLFVTSTDRVNTIASRMVDLTNIDGKTLTVFFSGFIVASANNNGPTINYFAVDETGNVIELDLIEDVTGIFESLVENFKNYPNPATDFTLIEFDNTNLSEVVVSLMDVTGKVLQHNNFELNNGFNQLRFELPNVANGIYFLGLKTEESISALPLIIAK